VSLAGALGAIVAAIAAFRAANETRKATVANFIFKDRDAYSSAEMLEGMMKLIEWQHTQGEAFARKFGKLRKEDYREIKPIDEARRRFSHYIHLPKSLWLKFKLIDERTVGKLRSKNQFDFYLKFVKPLDDEIELATEK